MKGKNSLSGVSKILSVLLSVAMIFGTLPIIAQAAPRTGSYYEKTTSITSGQEYAIVANSSNYALTAPTSATSVTVSGNYITSAVSSSMEWTLTSVGSAYYITNGTAYLIRGTGSTLKTGSQSDADSTHGQWNYSSTNNRIYISSYGGTYYLYRNGSSFGLSNSSTNTVYLYQKKTLAVSSITVNHAPAKTDYTEGDTFDPTGMVIRATYNDGSYEDISTSGLPDGYTYTPTGALSASEHSVSVSYGGQNTTQAITVAAKTVTRIEITAPPTKTTYDEGETFDPAGMVVTAHYSNGTSEPVTEYSVTLSGSLTPDVHSVTITYNDHTATQNITVNALELDHIAITAQPTKISYIEDQLFDPAGMVVTAYFTNGSHAAVTGYSWSPNTKLSTAVTQVTVSYKSAQDFQPITVAAKALDRITVTTPPTKTTYVAGQSFSNAGMVVKACYTNGLNEAVTGYSIDPSGELATTDTKITITFTYEGVIKSVDQPITLIAKALDHIAVTTPPAKTDYVVGQTFDPTGMAVTAYYNDDTDSSVTGYTCFPDRALIMTDEKVTVSYGDKSADQPITVAEATNAEAPIISFDTPVQWLAVDIGATASLSVTARVSKGVLTYQWYSNTTGLNSGGTAVGASSSEPSLTLDTTAAGTTFYYCVVTNTDTTATGNQTAAATSRAAQVVVRRDAQTPIIDPASPLDMSAYQGSTSSITVSASIDSGVLSYQWYSNLTRSNSGGTPVGSSSSSPALTLNTSAAGITYYYCVVTNTDNGAPGIKTATATSRAAKVDVSASTSGTVLFTFDDGWADQYTRAYPILDAAGFKGTAYVNSDFISEHEFGIMTVTQAQDLYNHGWDIANHTSTHEDEGVGDQTDQTHLAQLKTMYNDCADWLTSNGMPRAAYHVAYPSGLYTSDLIRLLKINGFYTGRATIFGQQYGIQYQNEFFTLPVYSLGDDNDLYACLEGIDTAANTGSTMIIMIHKVEPTAGELVTTTAQLQAVVDKAKSKGSQISVKTITQWYADQNQYPAGQTPPAPAVTGNDAANTVSGLNLVMEYKLDNASGYTMYDPAVFASVNLAGDHTLAVRYAASGVDPAGPDTILTFTRLLSGIEITTPPTNTAYIEGNTFDAAGMVVTANYDDGTSEAVTDYTVVPSGELAVTDTKITVSYTFADVTMTADQTITVNEKTLSRIAVTTEPTNMTYVEGTLFDPAGMVVTAYYDNGKSETVTDYTIDPSGELITTDTKVVISYDYKGVLKTADQPITVNAKKLTGIAITTAPTKTQYIEGQAFDATDMVITAYYDNGKNEDVTGYAITPSGELATTDTKVTISYTFADVTMTADQPITVASKMLNRIEITTLPSKMTYIEGNHFDPAGMVVTAYYDNGTNAAVTGYSIIPAGDLAITDTKITVNYGGKTAEQAITVAAKSLDRIAVTSAPLKTHYIAGQAFEPTGMVVTAYYDNGTSGLADGFTLKPGGALAITDTKVTVSFTYEGVTKTADQAITVIVKTITSLDFKTHPAYTNYVEGQAFNPAGMVLTATYNDGSSKEVQPGACTFSINRPLQVTDTSVVITFDTKYVTQGITVSYTYTSAQLKDITATAGTLSPVFNPNVKSYTLLLDEYTAKTTIKPVLADASSKLYINGKKTSSKAFTLATAKTKKVTIKVKPKTGKAITYTVTIKRAGSTNASLAYIKVSKGSLTKVSTTDYTVNLSNTQTKTKLRLKLSDKKAKYSITLDGKKTRSKTVSIKPGTIRTLVITVTPQAGSAYAVKYTIIIVRAISHNDNLAALKTSKGTLTPAFDPTLTNYSLVLESKYSRTKLTVKRADSTAKYSITVDGKKSGSTIKLAKGATKVVTIKVTSQAGDIKTYTVAITRSS